MTRLIQQIHKLLILPKPTSSLSGIILQINQMLNYSVSSTIFCFKPKRTIMLFYKKHDSLQFGNLDAMFFVFPHDAMLKYFNPLSITLQQIYLSFVVSHLFFFYNVQCSNIRDKVFKNESNKIRGNRPEFVTSRPYHFKFFKGCPFLNIFLSQK